MQHGVPYDTAFQMSPALRAAHYIVLMENEGNSFDVEAWRWRDRKR